MGTKTATGRPFLRWFSTSLISARQQDLAEPSPPRPPPAVPPGAEVLSAAATSGVTLGTLRVTGNTSEAQPEHERPPRPAAAAAACISPTHHWSWCVGPSSRARGTGAARG